MRRVYLETSPEETREIDEAILRDGNLQRQYLEIAHLKSEMDEAKIQPSESTTKNILNYARGLQEHR